MAAGWVDRTDDASFSAIFREHHRGAIRLAWLLLGDEQQAEDVVADAMTNVWLQWRRGRVDDVGAYLRRAVANGAKSRLRRRYLERREASRRRGDHRGPRRHDDQAVEHDVVWEAIQRLPARQRQVVVLRYYEDLSVADTADVLGISGGTVKSSLSRGLANLERMIEEPATTRGGR